MFLNHGPLIHSIRAALQITVRGSFICYDLIWLDGRKLWPVTAKRDLFSLSLIRFGNAV